MEYHPNEVPRKKIRELWQKHCGEKLSKTIAEGGLGIDKTIIGYSRPQSLKDVEARAEHMDYLGTDYAGFKKYLMGCFICKPYNLILNRRAIPRSHTINMAAVHC